MTVKLSYAVLNAFHPRKGSPLDATLSNQGSSKKPAVKTDGLF